VVRGGGARARRRGARGRRGEPHQRVGEARGMRSGLGFGRLTRVRGLSTKCPGSYAKNETALDIPTRALFGGDRLDCRLISKKIVGVFIKCTRTRVVYGDATHALNSLVRAESSGF